MTSLLVFTAIATGVIGYILVAAGNFKHVEAGFDIDRILAAKQMTIKGLLLLCLSLLLWLAALPDILKMIS